MLQAEQIQENWDSFLQVIETNISEPRKSQLLDFYKSHAERFALMPASSNSKYHNAFPGGYVDHVLRVVEAALRVAKTWESMGSDLSGFTNEELVFAAINHDLGKMGDLENPLYLPSQDEWRKKNMGEMYAMNPKVDFMNIPDRSLFILQQLGIKVTTNEMLAIRTHDGLYDEGNKSYLISYNPDSRPKTPIVHILHQADLMAAFIEHKAGKGLMPKPKALKLETNATANKVPVKAQALPKATTPGLKNIMDDFFN